MENRFDQLARALAEGVSRREALRRLGGGLCTALLGSLGISRAWGQAPVAPTQNICPFFCFCLPPGRQRAQCLAQGANGLCGACKADCSRLCLTPSGEFICCAAHQACLRGACAACPPDRAICNGVCCEPGETCYNGACVKPNPAKCEPTDNLPVCCGNHCPDTRVYGYQGGRCPRGTFCCQFQSCTPSSLLSVFRCCPSGDRCCGSRCCKASQVCIAGVCVDRIFLPAWAQ